MTEESEIALLFTDDQSIAAINAEWRGKDKPTNVLSFPAPRTCPSPMESRGPWATSCWPMA